VINSTLVLEKIMNRMNAEIRLGFVAVIFCLVGQACSLVPVASVGEERTETRSVDLGDAASVKALIEMDAGKMTVGGGASQLMEASFRYNVDEWKPNVEYRVDGGQGDLLVNQPAGQGKVVTPDAINEWDIRMNDGVPLDIHIRTGAGENNLDLSTLDLSAVQVEIGAGATTLDLGGNWDHDLNGSITGGVGKLVVTLPSEMGVRVNVTTGLGSVSASGLTQDGDGYINSAYGSAPYTLTLDIETGVGSIELNVP
jgi:N-terminal domain of toast_rack, DUF2154